MKFIIMHYSHRVGQVQAQCLEDANSLAREVFGDEVYCEAETDAVTEKDLLLEN